MFPHPSLEAESLGANIATGYMQRRRLCRSNVSKIISQLRAHINKCLFQRHIGTSQPLLVSRGKDPSPFATGDGYVQVGDAYQEERENVTKMLHVWYDERTV